MTGSRRKSIEAEPTAVAQQLEPKRHEVWWYRQGAYIGAGLMAAAVWFIAIGPKIATPKTEMVDPAATILETGIKQAADQNAISKELGLKVAPPDLRQLGGKLTKVGKAEFGGAQAAVMQYQYGKSVFLLYYFAQPSKQYKDMSLVHAGKNQFYLSSAGAVSVISWKDRRSGYYALVAKATEKDLVALAGKMVASF